MIKLIHIPKNAGTAFFLKLESLGVGNFESFKHSLHIETCVSRGINVCILRDPIDRAKSLFNFWKHGSEMYKDDSHFSELSFNEFWRLLANKDLDFIPSLEHNNISYIHFYPQSFWVPKETYKNTIVVLFNHLSDPVSMKNFYEYIGCEYSFDDCIIPRVNISNKEETIVDEDTKLNIKKLYSKDFILWDDCVQDPNKFLKVF